MLATTICTRHNIRTALELGRSTSMAISISMVALSKTAKISASGIAKTWATRWPNSPQLTTPEKKNNVLSFRVDNYDVLYALMPAPIPWSDLEGPCATSPFWPNAGAVMRNHERHLIVTVAGDKEQTGIELMEVLTHATAALIDSSEGVFGVYWCNSALVFPPKAFCDFVSRFGEGEPALPIWVNFRVAKNQDGTSAGFTRGLTALGQMDFETRSAPESPEALRDRFLKFAAYVLEGAAIKDGETIGFSANEKINVNYAPSSFGGPEQVMRLEFPSHQSSGTGRLTAYGYIHLTATITCTIAFGYLLYVIFPFLHGSIFRHLVLVPATLIFGVLLLLISDQILERAFGWQTFGKSTG